ncbi:MAG: cation diffusion facilitator family transporter [Bacteroidales bacterium]
MISENEKKDKNLVARLSVIAAVVITSAKFIVGFLTGSLGILSEALHSLLDLMAAIITMVTIRISSKPADVNHHFGHGKFENLSALIQTLLLLITCGWIIYEAIDRLQGGHGFVEVNAWSFGVILLSIIIDYNRSRALARVARKYNSQALEADALHFSTDIWSSSVVFFGLIFTKIGWLWADALAALLVAALVIWVSLQLGRRALNALLDRTPEGSVEKIRATLDQVEGLKYYHDIRIRTAGAETFIDLNIHVDENMTVKEAHDITEEIELRIQEVIPRSTVHIHQEPCE